ncbi:MAG: hypothetical protein U0746_21660 [Gemmataceae bacterium]
MADKRIWQLNTTRAFPGDAQLIVDSRGLSQSVAMDSGDLIDAVSLTLCPYLITDDPSQAVANSAAIDAALAAYAQSGEKKGTLKLPRGNVWVAHAIRLVTKHSGLTVDGDGCVLLTDSTVTDPNEWNIIIGLGDEANPMGFQANVAAGGQANQIVLTNFGNPDNYQVDDAILLFNNGGFIDHRQTPQQTAVIQQVDFNPSPRTLTLTLDTNPDVSQLNLAVYLFNGRKLERGLAVGARELAIPGPSAAALFPKNSWAYMTDGVGVYEVVGEFVRVLSATSSNGNTVIALEGGVRNAYLGDRVAIVPPGRWTEGVTVRGLTLGGAHAYDEGAQLVAKYCVDLRLERVRHTLSAAGAAAGLANHGAVIATCGRLAISDGQITGGKGLDMTVTRDVVVERSRVQVQATEFSSDIALRDCDIVRDYLISIGSERVSADGCRFWNCAIGTGTAAGDIRFRNCDVYWAKGTDGSVAVLRLQTDRCTIQGLRSYGGPLTVLGQSGTGHLIENLDANLELWPGTAGTIVEPVVGIIRAKPNEVLPENWVRMTTAQVGRILHPGDGSTVEVGTISVASFGSNPIWARVFITAHESGVDVTKVYEIARGYGNSTAWYRCLPLTEAVVGATKFDLDLQEWGNQIKLRLRRVEGLGDIHVTVRVETNGLFEGTAVVADGQTVAGIHASTALTQSGGLLRVAGVTALDGTAASFPMGVMTATVTNAGTAPVNLPNGLTVNGPSVAAPNPVLLKQNYGLNTYSVVGLQPTGGDWKCYLELWPSGTEVESGIDLINSDNTGNAGYLRLMVSGPTAQLRAFTVGSGATAIEQLDVLNLATKFHGDLVVAKTTAPADDDLANNQCGLWLDVSGMKPLLRFKAKYGTNSIANGEVALT